MARRIALAAAFAALAAGVAAAGEAQDRLFAPGLLDGVATGQRLVFAHERSGAAAVAPALAPIADGRVEILLAPDADGAGRSAAVTLREGTQTHALDPINASEGNPLLLVFMETSVASMAAATGGSPFYIRNRMRDALRSQDAGEPVEVEIDGTPAQAMRYSFRPFEADPNAARMGPFAAREVSVVLSDAAPGGFAALETVTGPGADGAPALRETMTYQGVEEGE